MTDLEWADSDEIIAGLRAKNAALKERLAALENAAREVNSEIQAYLTDNDRRGNGRLMYITYWAAGELAAALGRPGESGSQAGVTSET